MRIILIFAMVFFIGTAFADSPLEIKSGDEYIFKISDDNKTPEIVYKVSADCVKKQTIIDAIESLLNSSEPNTSGAVITICNTCECWHNGDMGSASYYECKAAEARNEEKYFTEKRDLVEKIKKNGVCPY